MTGMKKVFAGAAFAVFAVMVLPLHSHAGFTFEWQDVGFTEGDQTRLFDFSGNEVTFDAAGYTFQMVIDVNNDTDFSEMISRGESFYGWGIGAEDHMSSMGTPDLYNADDDILVDVGGENTWLVVPDPDRAGLLPEGATIPAAYNNTRFYFRWFNAGSIEDATQAGVIFNTEWVTPASTATPMDTARLTFGWTGVSGGTAINDGSIYSSGNPDEGWQSMAMVPEPGTFALFGLGLLTLAARRKLRKNA